MATTVGLISLGCSKNRVDSEQMLAVLKEHGYQIVSDPSRAEVIIVNTCGFIQSAKEEAISTLFEMAGYKQTGCCRLLVATGCFAQRYPEAIREVCRLFKERGMMLRTTLMVGFPGETEEDFDELMDFVKEIKFDRMGAFMFCPEDGTRAAEMPDQIPEEVKQERYDRLMTLQHGVSLAQNKARVGTTCRVLVEKKRGSRYVGRSEYEAPETDGSIFFGSEEPCEIGSFVNVKITAAKAYDLMGERV